MSPSSRTPSSILDFDLDPSSLFPSTSSTAFHPPAQPRAKTNPSRTGSITSILRSIRRSMTPTQPSPTTQEEKANSRVFPDAKGRPGLKDVAGLIRAGKAKNILVMTGAGISTAAGIPDFRSPDTGLYANVSGVFVSSIGVTLELKDMTVEQLEKYDLPYPQAIFDIEYFVLHPEAFFTLAKELYPGNFHPTITHYFFKLLNDKGLLLRCFSQNIDTLERVAGLPESKLVEAHGSFALAHCLSCNLEMTAEELRPRIMEGDVVRCKQAQCKGIFNNLIKPDIVFFGEGLPKRFFSHLSTDFPACDLLLILGTSLQVQPFASLLFRVPPDCPRVLINLEAVGEIDVSELGVDGNPEDRSDYDDGLDFGGVLRGGEGEARDVCFLGTADEGVLELAEELGWKDELLALYEAGKASFGKTQTPTTTETEEEKETSPSPSSSRSTNSTTPSSSKEPESTMQDAAVRATRVAAAVNETDKQDNESKDTDSSTNPVAVDDLIAKVAAVNISTNDQDASHNVVNHQRSSL